MWMIEKISFPNMIQFKSKNLRQPCAVQTHSFLPTLSTVKFLSTEVLGLFFFPNLEENPENFASFSQVIQILPLMQMKYNPL